MERETIFLSPSARQDRLQRSSRCLQDSDKEFQSANPTRETLAFRATVPFRPLCASQDRSEWQSLRLHLQGIRVFLKGHRVLHPHHPRREFWKVDVEKLDRRHRPCSLRSG